MFRDATVSVEIVWEKMVLILKGEGGYRDIGLVEVLCKVRSVVVNFRLKRSAMLHDALHGFREGIGMGTVTLEANLDQKLAGITHEPLFQVFLYVWKAYDLLDWDRCLKLLREYGMGPNLARLLEDHWRRQRIFPKVGKYLGTAFGTGQGVTQGDPTSTMIFNIVVDAVDAVVREVLEEVCSLVFNVDDGRIAGRDH